MEHLERLQQSGWRHLGTGQDEARRLEALLDRAPLLEEFATEEVAGVAPFLDIFEAEPGQVLMSEGDESDFLALLLAGSVDVLHRDRWGQLVRVAVVQPGFTLGEMSMLDGGPRFSSCVTLEPTRVAILGRDCLQRLMREQPRVASKILLALAHMLTHKLRSTSNKLVNYIEGGAVTSTELPRMRGAS
jgi:CRP/FNR family cyclic AMP-dependent transcriptional regulator